MPCQVMTTSSQHLIQLRIQLKKQNKQKTINSEKIMLKLFSLLVISFVLPPPPCQPHSLVLRCGRQLRSLEEITPMLHTSSNNKSVKRGWGRVGDNGNAICLTHSLPFSTALTISLSPVQLNHLFNAVKRKIALSIFFTEQIHPCCGNHLIYFRSMCNLPQL